MRRICVALSVVCLISFLCAACSGSRSSSGNGDGPVADFAANPTSGPAPLNVQFTSLCTGAIDTYSWDFGDGGTSAQASPLHTYIAEGVYTVTLTVVGPGGSDTEIKSAFIKVGLGADFTASPTTGPAPLEVQFTDLSTPAASILTWFWDFGDGGTSNEQNPLYQYTSNGTYTVSLAVSDGTSSDTEIKTNYITVSDTPPPTGDWETLTSGTAEDLYGISFASTSIGWAVGANNTLLYTNDGGDSWTSQTAGIYSAEVRAPQTSPHTIFPKDLRNDFLCVHAVSTSVAWVSCFSPRDGLSQTPCYVTKDGGQTWTCIVTATNFEEWSIYGFDGDNARICSLGAADHPDSDVFLMTNGYNNNRILLRWGGLYAITFGDSNNGWTVGTDIYRTTNGGSSWSEQTKPAGAGQLYGVDALSANTAWACGSSGSIIKTTNGTTWTKLTSGVSATLRDIDFLDANNGWCVGNSGTIIATTGGGATWTPQDSPATSTLRAVSAVDTSHIWVCGAGGLVLRSGR